MSFQFFEECHWYYGRDCLESLCSFGCYHYLKNVDFTNPQASESLSTFQVHQFLYLVFGIFHCKGHSYFGELIFMYFIFIVFIAWIFFTITSLVHYWCLGKVLFLKTLYVPLLYFLSALKSFVGILRVLKTRNYLFAYFSRWSSISKNNLSCFYP